MDYFEALLKAEVALQMMQLRSNHWQTAASRTMSMMPIPHHRGVFSAVSVWIPDSMQAYPNFKMTNCLSQAHLSCFTLIRGWHEESRPSG